MIFDDEVCWMSKEDVERVVGMSISTNIRMDNATAIKMKDGGLGIRVSLSCFFCRVRKHDVYLLPNVTGPDQYAYDELGMQVSNLKNEVFVCGMCAKATLETSDGK